MELICPTKSTTLNQNETPLTELSPNVTTSETALKLERNELNDIIKTKNLEIVDISKFKINKISDDETFVLVKDFPEYLLSNYGRIYSKFRSRLKTPDNNGCRNIISFTLRNRTENTKNLLLKSKRYIIHELVSLYFLKDPESNEDFLIHLDNRLDNNYYKNLKYVNFENYFHEKYRKDDGEKFVLLEEDNHYILSNYGRIFSRYKNNFATDRCRYIRENNKPKERIKINKLIGKYFLHNDDPERKTEIRHLDGNLCNHHFSNLEWARRGDSRIRENLSGRRFGKLTVLGLDYEAFDSNRGSKWFCQCDCDPQGKNIKSVTRMALVTARIPTRSCGCSSIDRGLRTRSFNNPNWLGYGEISGSFWNRIVLGATKFRDIGISVKIEDVWNLFLKQNRKCSLTGLEIKFASHNRDETTASLDRIDSSRPYEDGNIQWVHKDVNWMKQSFDEKYFIEICGLIHNHSKNKYN